MAGIILTIGNNDLCNHKKLHNSFLKNSFIETSTQKSTSYYRLSKFKRINQKDFNFIDDDTVSIYCVGNVACKDTMGKEALKSLCEELQNRNPSEIVSMLDGHFVLLIIKHNENRVYIVTDHLGIIHIYKYFDGKRIYLTTSSLVLSRNENVTLDIDNTIQFLRCDSICDCGTIYKEINLLEPGCIYQYEIKRDIVEERKHYYWKSPTTIEEKINLEDATELWKIALIETCNKIPKDKIICDLTGGFDTRSILAALLHKEDIKLEKFSAFSFGPEYSKDVQVAKNICKNLDLAIMHAHLPDEWENEYYEHLKESILLTDGEENACKYAPIMYANDKKTEKYDYSINGLGGPIVKSFNWIQEINIRKKPANLRRFVYMRALKSEFNTNIFNKIWRDNIFDLIDTLTKKYLNTISDMHLNGTFNTLQLDNIDFRQRERRWGGRTISSSNRIINIISPLYFKKCIEVGMIIPPRFKKNKRLIRSVVTKLHPGLAKEKMANGATCEDITLNNFYKFYPLISSPIKKSLKASVKKIFDKDIFIASSTDYQRFNWYKKLFSEKKNYNIGDIENWETATIYRHEKLKEFVESAKEPGFKYYTQLEKMITLEMRIREDNIKNS